MDTLKFYLGDETHVVIEDKSKREESIFSSQYEYAFNEIKALLPIICGENQPGKEKSRPISELIPNNVFAFIGDRGSGKTSCMLSVASMLRKGEVDGIDKRCCVLDLIDPSFFDKGVNILDIVIGKMFSSFKQSLQGQQSFDIEDTFINKKHQLYEGFQKVRDCLVNIQQKEEKTEDSVEHLSNLASSVELQQAIRQLTAQYLQFNNDDILVIPVDDIDLHTECAYTMIEQIRKYLVQKNIVVLMAVRIEQLRTVIENEYAIQYQTSLKESWVKKEYIGDMAARYLVKFIPQSHRIFMPDMNVYMDTALQLWERGKQVWPKEREAPTSLKYAIAGLIYKKTRFLFYHRKGNTSPIVPTNLREIRHLIVMLHQMPDYYNDEKKIKHDENKVAFKHYFFETWVPNNLDSDGAQSISKVERVRDASIFNKTVLLELKYRFNTKIDFPEGIKEILDEKNVAFNISMGDVFCVIDYVKKRNTNSFDVLYIFALETIYSMRMYEYYDVMTEKDAEKDKIIATNSVDDTIKKRSMFDDIELYHIISGGSFLNSSMTSYVADNNKNLPRNKRQIKLSKINEWINNFNTDKTHKHYLWAAEWICLFIAGRDYENSKIKNVGKNFRYSGSIVYNEDVSGFDNLVFDITSLFYNITNIKRSYDRVNEKLYGIASATEDSLYKKLLEKANLRSSRDLEKEHKLLSWSCIRNAEILDDFSDELSAKVKSVSTNDIDNYIDFLRRVGEYNILTYDKENNEPYTISFDYVSVILEIIKKDEVRNELEAIFPELKEIDVLTNVAYGKILLGANSAERNKQGKLASGTIKKVVKKVVPLFSNEKLDEVFPKNSAFLLEDVKDKLLSLQK